MTGDVSLAERTIILNPNLLTIPIGRASKSVSKGIVGAQDNAWFDSPVMSRDHAEMCLNPDINVITIHDIGSMHGTYINNKQLIVREPTQISDGDEITFGAEVKRGVETFPACAFRVKIEFVHYEYVTPGSVQTSEALANYMLCRAVNSYAFPDSSDVEDEEDCDLSDDIVQDGSHSSSEDDASIEIPSFVKTSQAINTIDLTREESPFLSSSNRVDLTGEASGEIQANETAHAVSVFNLTAEPILLESEDEEEGYGHFSSDSDDQPDIADSTESDSSEDEDVELQEVEDSDSQDEIEDDVEDDVEDDEEVDVEEGDSEADNVEMMVEHTHEVAENTNESHVSNWNRYLANEQSQKPFDSDIIQTERPSQIFVDADDESDYGLSDAGEEGIRALFADDLHSDSDASEPASNKEAQAAVEQHAAQIASSPNMSYQQTWDGDAVGLLCKAATLNPPAKFSYTISQPFPGERQPSPSDAAMVKAAPHKRPEQTLSNVADSRVPIQTSCRLSQTLGDKTGKHAFFEARENNKAKVLAPVDKEDDTCATSFSSSNSALFSKITASKNENIATHVPSASNTVGKVIKSVRFGERMKFARSSSTAKHGGFGMFKHITRCSYLLIYVATIAPNRSALSFDFQDNPLSVKRAPSPEYDMTSAVKFNESKAMSVRSRLSIPDIIENSSLDQGSQKIGSIGEKRKAGDISNVIESEIREWASLDASKPAISGLQARTAEAPVVQENEHEQRPVKKLKTILERAAYAAVGGVAVGAGLFFSLVATAPDFA